MPTAATAPRHDWTTAAAIVLVLAAVVLLGHATSSGLGLSDDSISYVDGAQTLRAEPFRLFSLPDAHFPPLYPAALAPFAGPGDVTEHGRALHLGLLAVNGGLFFALVRRRTEGVIALLSLTVLLVSRQVIVQVHGNVLSESLFVMLLLGALLATDQAWARGGETDGRWLAVAGGLAGLAALTRVVGLALVPVLVLIAWRFVPPARRLRTLGVTVTLAVTPVAIWFLTRSSDGDLADRPLAYHPPPFDAVRRAPGEWAEWLVPEQLLQPGRGLIEWLLLGATVLALCLLVRFVIADHNDDTPAQRTMTLLAATTVSLVGIVLAGRTLADAEIPLDRRLFFPAYVTALAFVAIGMQRSRLTAGGRRQRATGVVVIAVLALVVANAARLSEEVRDAHTDGIGQLTVAVRQSPLIEFGRGLPAGAVVYSNSSASYWLLDAPGEPIPRRFSRTDLSENEDLVEDLRAMADDVTATGGAVLYFDDRRQASMPLPAEIVAATDLVIGLASDDGVALVAPPDR